MKNKLNVILHGPRKAFFPSNDEVMEQVISAKEPGLIGKIFLAIYFPSPKENISKQIQLNRILNRAILIACIMGFLCLWSKYLELHFIEGIFLILTMASWFPYLAHLVIKKSLRY